MPAGSDLTEALKANPVAKLLTQIEQNTRSEKTAVLYKTRQNLGANKVVVKIRSNIYAITDIDNVKQEFTANIAVRARWKEALFQDTPENADIDWDDQWNPRLELDNAVTTTNFDRKYELRYFHTDVADRIPHVVLTMNITATFKEMFELDEFPLDYQALNIWLISEWPFDQLMLVKDDEYMDHLTTSTFTESKEWHIYPQLIGEPVGEPEEINEITGSTAQYPLYTITAQVKRIHSFYMWNHVLYMFMIFMVALSTFSIPVTEVGFRISGAFLILISALVYRLYMQPSLPVIAYWTALDKYNMAIMCCHILIIIEHAIIGKISQSYPDQAENADVGCLGGVVAVMLAVQCYFIAFYVQTLNKRDKFLTEETKNFTEMNQEIWGRYEDRVKTGKWKYEPAPQSTRRDTNGLGSHTPRSYLVRTEPQPHVMVRAGNPPSGNPLSRQGSQRQSGRMQVGAPPPPPLPPMPSPGHVRHLSAERFQGRDIMNPAETTHEIKIPMPPEVLSAPRSRSTSRSRSRTRRRGHRSNKVASEQGDTTTDHEE